MDKFKGMLICTDLDGTLLRSDKTISDENKKAIEYFKSEGGYFTFVTGRMPFFARDTYDAIKANAPVGCVNGGGLYDYERQKYLWTAQMPENVIDLVSCIDKKFPNVGIQVNTYDKIYFCKENKVMEIFRELTGVENLVGDYNEVAEPIAKIVFGCETEEDILAVEKCLKEHPMAEKFDFIRSEQTLYEILPKGVGKGNAVKKLAEVLELDPKKTIAIGDYNNDISMLEAAYAGVAVSNACAEAKAAADFITVSNDEHAIASVIYNLAENADEICFKAEGGSVYPPLERLNK